MLQVKGKQLKIGFLYESINASAFNYVSIQFSIRRLDCLSVCMNEVFDGNVATTLFLVRNLETLNATPVECNASVPIEMKLRLSMTHIK